MTSVLGISAAPGAADSAIDDAQIIASVRHREAARLAQAELERFAAVVEPLADDDRDRPTACPLWNVRQLVAHVTGAAAAFTSWSLFRRQATRQSNGPIACGARISWTR
jgi:hypothetical protein